MGLWYKTYSKPHIRLTTQLCYENRIYLHIIPSVGEIPLNKLTQSDLQKFYADLKKNGRKSKVERYGTGVSIAWFAPAMPPAALHCKRQWKKS